MTGPKVKLALFCGAAALTLSACGTTAKPLAGTPNIAHAPGTRGKIDDPRTNKNDHVACLKAHHIPLLVRGATDIQIGAPPAGPFVHFSPTPGAAQEDQISGEEKYDGAEVIGSALLWPNQGSDAELKTVENCLAHGVAG